MLTVTFLVVLFSFCIEVISEIKRIAFGLTSNKKHTSIIGFIVMSASYAADKYLWVNEERGVTSGHYLMRNVLVGYRSVVTTRQSTLVGVCLRLSC